MRHKGHPFFTPPICNDRRRKCFALLGDGRCDLLNSSYEKGKKCPFYKTRKQYERGFK